MDQLQQQAEWQQLDGEWCEHDPKLVLTDEEGKIRFHMTAGTPSTADLRLLQEATYSVRVVQGDPDRVTAGILVEPPAGHAPLPVRLVVSSRAFGRGTIYGRATGDGGELVAVTFDRPGRGA